MTNLTINGVTFETVMGVQQAANVTTACGYYISVDSNNTIQFAVQDGKLFFLLYALLLLKFIPAPPTSWLFTVGGSTFNITNDNNTMNASVTFDGSLIVCSE